MMCLCRALAIALDSLGLSSRAGMVTGSGGASCGPKDFITYRMKRLFPNDYSFFPNTWLLPYEWSDLRVNFMQNKGRTYIVKPEASSQGRGIHLTRTFENIVPTEHYVVQQYINKPYLIEGLKFDLRIYVLVYGCDPLRIFVYNEGLARLATDAYSQTSSSNLNNLYMHLTNYSINKNNNEFIFNKNSDNADVGHKRSLSYVWNHIDDNGGDSIDVQDRIYEIIVKTLCAVQPQLADGYRTYQASDDHNDKCFEILGFDIMLDSNLKPWLIEVNHAPSFSTDTPFDLKVKSQLIEDTFILLNINPEKRLKYYRKRENEMKNNWFARHRVNSSLKLPKELRDEHKRRHMEKRDNYEFENSGGYLRIYPDFYNPNKYSEFLEAASRIWSNFFIVRRPKELRITQRVLTNRKPLAGEDSKYQGDGVSSQETKQEDFINRNKQVRSNKMSIPHNFQHYNNEKIAKIYLSKQGPKKNPYLPAVMNTPSIKRVINKGIFALSFRNIGKIVSKFLPKERNDA